MKAPRKKKKSTRLRPRLQEEQLQGKALWLQRGIIAAAALIMIGALSREPQRQDLPIDDVEQSVVSPHEIRAEFFFESIDLLETKDARNAAAAKVPDNYRVNPALVEHALAELDRRVSLVAAQQPAVAAKTLAALEASTSVDDPLALARRVAEEHAASLAAQPDWQGMPAPSVLSLWLMPDVSSLPARVYEIAADESAAPAADPVASPVAAPTGAEVQRETDALEPTSPGSIQFSQAERLAQLARDSLRFVLTRGVRDPGVVPTGKPGSIVILREDAPADLGLTSGEIALADVPTPETAREVLAERLRETARRAARPEAESAEWAQLHEAALAMAAQGLSPTIQFDRVATAGAVQAARDSVAPLLREIEAGEIIQENGRRWTEQSRSDALAYLAILSRENDSPRRFLSVLGAHIMMVALALLGLRGALPLLVPERQQLRLKALNLALLLMASTAVIGRVASYFEPTGFMLPVAAAGILYAILVNSRAATVFSLLNVFILSAQYGYDWRLLFAGAAMSLAGIFAITKVRRRSDMTTASLKAAAAGLAAMAAILMISDSLLSNTALQRLTLVLLNGGICLLVVPAMLSPLEKLFEITTDIQMLEYSDLNNEVLSRLALEVPGTFSHSLMIGQLGEAAADAIGANGLKTRVMAYYHDIGKMWRPEFFCENQGDENVHDELAPRVSARAIAAHVTQGAEMARREYHLPKPIIDGILEHHGTAKIGFFYEQAIEQKKHGDVDEDDFRYPGPKPQSPETAILMICDGAESAVRSIKNPNEDRIREMIDKIIATRAADRQFDDCDLTFKQLDIIAEVITRRACSSLHKRISYPSTKEQDNIIPMAGGGLA